jgi:hypothetical protein
MIKKGYGKEKRFPGHPKTLVEESTHSVGRGNGSIALHLDYNNFISSLKRTSKRENIRFPFQRNCHGARMLCMVFKT